MINYINRYHLGALAKALLKRGGVATSPQLESEDHRALVDNSLAKLALDLEDRVIVLDVRVSTWSACINGRLIRRRTSSSTFASESNVFPFVEIMFAADRTRSA